MLTLRIIILCVFLCFSSFLSGQQSNSELAELYFQNEKFEKALPLFLEHQKLEPKNLDLKYKIGICYLNVGNPSRAQDFLEFVVNDKKSIDKANFYLAKAHHVQHNFDDAIRYYKGYLPFVKLKSYERDMIKEEIKRCVVGRKLIWKSEPAVVESLGDRVNTSNDEFAPVVDPYSSNTVFFSSGRPSSKGGLINSAGYRDTLAGSPRSDIYVTRLLNGEWSIGSSIGDEFNTTNHEVLLDFNAAGSWIYYFSGTTGNKGSLFARPYLEPGQDPATGVKMPSPLNSADWDSDAYFFNDSVLVFSSDRPGGYGGKDLYIAYRQQEEWKRPVNLGPAINSAYDEICPFLAKDGRTLFFASDNLKSLGGLDIFQSVFQDSIYQWTEAQNMGMPINSAGDDLNFRMTSNAMTAYYSSDRPGGHGGQDLYVAYFNSPLEAHLVTSNPNVFLNVEQLKPEPVVDPNGLDEPIAPVIEEGVNIGKKEVKQYRLGPVYYDQNQGQLDPSAILMLDKLKEIGLNNPEVEFLFLSHTDNSGFAANNLYFSLKRAERMANYLVEAGINPAHLHLKACGSNYPIATNTNADGTENTVGQTMNRRIDLGFRNIDGAAVQIDYESPQVNEMMVNPLNQVYRQKSSGLSYKVQVVAARNRFDDPIMTEIPDGMIEASPGTNYKLYTVGLTKTFFEIAQVKKQVIDKGFTDAFIVAYYNGRRIDDNEAIQLAPTFPDLNKYITAKSRE